MTENTVYVILEHYGCESNFDINNEPLGKSIIGIFKKPDDIILKIKEVKEKNKHQHIKSVSDEEIEIYKTKLLSNKKKFYFNIQRCADCDRNIREEDYCDDDVCKTNYIIYKVKLNESIYKQL